MIFYLHSSNFYAGGDSDHLSSGWIRSLHSYSSWHARQRHCDASPPYMSVYGHYLASEVSSSGCFHGHLQCWYLLWKDPCLCHHSRCACWSHLARFSRCLLRLLGATLSCQRQDSLRCLKTFRAARENSSSTCQTSSCAFSSHAGWWCRSRGPSGG